MNPLLRNIKISWVNGEIHPVEQFFIDLLKNSTVDFKLHKTWYCKLSNIDKFLLKENYINRNDVKEDKWIIQQHLGNGEFFISLDIFWWICSKYKIEYKQLQEVATIILTKNLNCFVSKTYIETVERTELNNPVKYEKDKKNSN